MSSAKNKRHAKRAHLRLVNQEQELVEKLNRLRLERSRQRAMSALFVAVFVLSAALTALVIVIAADVFGA